MYLSIALNFLLYIVLEFLLNFIVILFHDIRKIFAFLDNLFSLTRFSDKNQVTGFNSKFNFAFTVP